MAVPALAVEMKGRGVISMPTQSVMESLVAGPLSKVWLRMGCWVASENWRSQG